MNRLLISRRFVASAVFLLAAFATILVVGNCSSAHLASPRDPATGAGMDWMFWGVSAACGIVVLVCLKTRSLQIQLALLLWLSLNLALWRVSWSWLGVRDPGGYFTGLAQAFQMSPSGMYTGLGAIVAYLLFFSTGLIAWNYFASRLEIKLTCEKCGGHVVFSQKAVGQHLPCPHCGHPLKLRPPGNLKMSCYFCQGHIEFPSHALGTKMPCPHCQRDITLVEPK